MNWLKNLYKKYYYIAPLDLADSAESNRLFNLYWSVFGLIVSLPLLIITLIKFHGNYGEFKNQIIFWAVCAPDVTISFFLSLAVKNVDRKKAYIFKNIPIYFIYFIVGTGTTIFLFYIQENHYNGLILFNAATCVVLTVLDVSLPIIINIIAACFIMLPGVIKFWGPMGTFNFVFMIVLLLFMAFYNRFRLKQKLALLKTQKQNLEAKTFGNFTLFYNNKVIKFSRSKSTELLAYLIYKNGCSLNTKELLSVLYGDYADSAKYGSSLRLLVSDVKHTLEELNIQNFFIKEYNSFRINPEVVHCDYYDFLAGDSKAIKAFAGEFMSQYSWAEDTAAFLERKVLEK